MGSMNLQELPDSLTAGEVGAAKYQPIVSIVIRTRNRPITLDRALRSIVKQTFPSWELALINDGGDIAAMRSVVARYALPLNGRCEILNLERRKGMQAAANNAIAATSGRYVVIHDDDDSWHPDFLAKSVSYLEAAPRGICGVTVGTEIVTERFQGDQLIEIGRKRLAQPTPLVGVEMLMQRNVFPPISFLYRREAGSALGFYREDLRPLGDWEFNVRLAKRFEIGVILNVLAYWHLRPGCRRGPYANSTYRAHLADLMKLQREWGRARPLWRYLLWWRY
jgi:glycosyltransferase involved in cell wall biosynthesis